MPTETINAHGGTCLIGSVPWMVTLSHCPYHGQATLSSKPDTSGKGYQVSLFADDMTVFISDLKNSTGKQNGWEQN